MHVILAPVHAILLCIIQANYVRHPYAGALLSSARADVEIFLRRHCRRRGKKTGSGQCTVEIPVQSQHANSIRLSHHITARQQFPESCNSLLETAHTQKKDVSSQGPLLKKKRALSVHAQVSFMSSQATLTRAVLISVSFKSDEHQYSSSKASATERCAGHSSGLRLDLAHRHPASPVSCQLPTLPNFGTHGGVYGASDSLSSLSDASCPGGQLSLKRPRGVRSFQRPISTLWVLPIAPSFMFGLE